ncbi:MAG: NAD-dependent epimerase/dehydratase family protein [Rubrivivax sp.]|nr:NAD-dependent epimerase/dehydratase family protein [Rubrivivax sp.]
MKIFIAGGAGYIGSVLTPKLLARGYDVDVMDLLWFGNHLPAAAKLRKGDVMDLKEDDLKGYDCVIFLAGLSNDPMAEYSPARNFVENASAPAYLAYIAKRAGVKRFIHGGSCSVYGYTVNELYDETAPTTCAYPYGISKLQGEYGALQMADESFSVIGFRQGTVSGFSPRMRLDLVINTMFKSAIQDKVITVNNPAIWRPVLAIRDAADAYVRAIESTQEVSGVFNIASGNYTIGEIADLVNEGVREYLGVDSKIIVKNIQDFRNYKVSAEKAKRILSFNPRFDAKDIVKDLVDNLDQFKDFTRPEYYNIRTFKELDASAPGKA